MTLHKHKIVIIIIVVVVATFLLQIVDFAAIALQPIGAKHQGTLHSNTEKVPR